jgi:hypothetical protein
MKNIKIIFTSLLFLLIATSCEDDGGSSDIGVTEAGIPNVRKVATTDQGINIVALQNGEDINLGLTIDIGTGDIASMDVIGYFTKSGVVSRAVLQTGITTFPTTVTYKRADLIKAFPTLASFGLTDKLVITADVKLKNGTVYPMFTNTGTPNYGADVANSTVWKVSQTYTALCPLEDASLFNGDYKVTADQWSDYTVGTIIPVVYNSADGTFSFRILATKNPYILNAATAYMLVTVNPVTNAVTVKSNEDFNYGGGDTTAVTGTGTVGSCNGDINLKLDFPGFGAGGYNFNLVKN